MAQSLESPFETAAFRSYIFFSVILIFKMFFMALYTGFNRFKNKAFSNPEDGALLKVKPRVDENVERIRRAHLNDLENIPLFLFAAFFYTLTNPPAGFAKLLFGTFTAARILHTIVYAIIVLPQPARGLSYFIGVGITAYMSLAALWHFQ